MISLKRSSHGFADVAALLLFVLALVVVGGVVYSVLSQTTDSSVATLTDEEVKKIFECDRVTADYRPTDRYCSEPNQYNKDLADGKVIENDDQIFKYNDLRAMIGSIVAYKVSKGNFPTSSEGGWADYQKFLTDENKKTHPDTGKPLTYTSTTPDIGEIQYESGSVCDNETKEFVAAGGSASFAFRFMTEDGLECVSNL